MFYFKYFPDDELMSIRWPGVMWAYQAPNEISFRRSRQSHAKSSERLSFEMIPIPDSTKIRVDTDCVRAHSTHFIHPSIQLQPSTDQVWSITNTGNGNTGLLINIRRVSHMHATSYTPHFYCMQPKLLFLNSLRLKIVLFRVLYARIVTHHYAKHVFNLIYH